MFQYLNTTELPSRTIITHLDGKYAVLYHIIDLVGAVAKVQTLACNGPMYIQTLYNRGTTDYNFIPTSNFYLE